MKLATNPASTHTGRPHLPWSAIRAAAFVAASTLGVALEAQAGEQISPTGTIAFGGFKGDARTYKPGGSVWYGTFVGVSVSAQGKGLFHGSHWDCDAELVNKDGTQYKGDGFCRITDPDGDTVDLLWARTDLPGGTTELKTRGTYFSGTGKYAGIQGYYTFSCRLGGILCTTTGGEYTIP
jgi:hypothetical protein